MKRLRFAFLALAFCAFVSPARAQLDRCLEAHGGLSKWRSFAGVEYDLTWKSAKGEKKDHQLFDLHTRDGLITSDKYSLGSSHGEVWVKPGLAALGGTPPRFYMGTPFYFFGMPFVFGDPGAKQESLGKKMFQGQEYDAVKITFGQGTGDTPDDYYVVYLDPSSAQLKMVYYVVTYPAMRKGRAVSALEPHAIVFKDWQKVEGLLVPKDAPFYKWTGDGIEGEPLGHLDFSNVHFLKKSPAPEQFQKPADAVVAPL
ncbi:MAG: DUF6503 family protein [Chthoniobacterales bacterium]